MVLPYINMNLPRVYMCSPSWTPFPPHPIPLGHPSAPALSILYHASNLDRRFVSHMILYMFQCLFPISSRPHPLPESKRLFNTSVSFLLSHIQRYHYLLSKFHIYMLVYCIGVFLSGLLIQLCQILAVANCYLFIAPCGISILQPGTELEPPAVEAVLTTGSPGKSLQIL